MFEILSDSTPWVALICTYGLLTHGIILLNDGLYWDGWVVDTWQRNRDKKSMRRFYSEVGMANLYIEHWLLGRIPARFIAYRLISLVSLQLIAVFIFLLAVQSELLNTEQAVMVSLLALSYPAYAVTMDGIVSLQYTFKVALFYASCFLAVVAVDQYDATGYALFAVALVLFYFAFNANSVLVYFWGFLLFYAWMAISKSPPEFAVHEYTRISVLTILPFSYWLIKEKLAPRHGYYETYNRLGMNPSKATVIGFQALRFGIDSPLFTPVRGVLKSKNLTLASLALGTLFYDFSKDLVALPILDSFAALGIGYSLVLLAAAPFMLVGQYFSEGGWNSKNFMLFHLPFALVVFGWLQATPNSYGLLLIPVILLANAFYIIRIHLLYIAVSVKDKALAHWMAANSQLRQASVIKIRDTHWIEYPFEDRRNVYRPAYLSSMTKGIWPESRTLVTLDSWNKTSGRALTPVEIEQALEETTIRYSFAPQVQSGPQYLLSIIAPDGRVGMTEDDARFEEPGKAVDPLIAPAMTKMALKYLYVRTVRSGDVAKLYEQYFRFDAAELESSLGDSADVADASFGDQADPEMIG